MYNYIIIVAIIICVRNSVTHALRFPSLYIVIKMVFDEHLVSAPGVFTPIHRLI